MSAKGTNNPYKLDQETPSKETAFQWLLVFLIFLTVSPLEKGNH